MTLSRRTITLVVWTVCLGTQLGLAGVKRPPIDPNTPDGRLLAQLQAETDPVKRLYLLELFPTLFPTSPLAGYIWSELQDRYRVAGSFDKALKAGASLLAIEPNNLDAACLNWRMAVDLKFPALETDMIAQTAAVAERAFKTPDLEMSKAALDCGNNALEAVQFEEYRAAVSTPRPAERIKALDEFVKNHPKNSHADDIEIYEFMAYRELGNAVQTLAMAEKIVAHNETRQDAMLLVADAWFKAGRDPNRVVHLARKTIELVNSSEKPEGVAAADWARSKAQNLTRLNYMIGFINFQSQHWDVVDQAYREALPNITDPRERAEILSSLGWANYQLRNVQDAIRFYTECTAIPGPLQLTASKTLNSITAEYRLK